MGVAFAPPIARGFHTHQAGIHRVLDVALQNAVFDQHIALTGMAFIVHVQRAAAIGQGAVVQHGHALCGHALANAAAESAGAFAVEVAFQAMTNGFMQEHAGPTGP